MRKQKYIVSAINPCNGELESGVFEASHIGVAVEDCRLMMSEICGVSKFKVHIVTVCLLSIEQIDRRLILREQQLNQIQLQ